jgi:hypothetical protein
LADSRWTLQHVLCGLGCLQSSGPTRLRQAWGGANRRDVGRWTFSKNFLEILMRFNDASATGDVDHTIVLTPAQKSLDKPGPKLSTRQDRSSVPSALSAGPGAPCLVNSHKCDCNTCRGAHWSPSRHRHDTRRHPDVDLQPVAVWVLVHQTPPNDGLAASSVFIRQLVHNAWHGGTTLLLGSPGTVHHASLAKLVWQTGWHEQAKLRWPWQGGCVRHAPAKIWLSSAILRTLMLNR